MHGARVIALRGNFDEALSSCASSRSATRSRSSTASTRSGSRARRPPRSRSLEELGERRRAVHPGRQRRQHHRLLEGLREAGEAPRMLGFQAAGAAPLVLGAPVEKPETVASAIRIGNPARWEEAMAAVTESRGAIEAVTDEEILDRLPAARRARGRLLRARERGVVAGLLKHGAAGARAWSACSPATA
jgi:threonine synthase